MAGSTRLFELSGRAALLAFLLFLYFPLADLTSWSPSTAHLAVVVAALTVFVGLYLSLMLTSARPLTRPREWARFGALTALALALAFDPSAEWAPVFIYVSAVCGFRLLPERAVPAIVACTAVAAAVGVIRGYPSGDVISIALYALGIGLILLAFSRLLHANAELQAAREELAQLAVAEERLRFARDLHDLLGHSLSVIALKSELAGRLLEHEPARAASEVEEIEQVSRAALQEVREAVSGYRRMTLADELAGARMALSAAGIDATVEQAEVALPPDAESILAWAVREGATNVIRHSGARRCEIRVTAGLASADVEVVDDGLGAAGAGGGTGLAGLTERAMRRHGRVEAGPCPDGGFRLRVSVPTA